MNKLTLSRLLVAAGITAGVSISDVASADQSAACTISQIGLDFGGAGPRLKLLCDGVFYYTNPGGGCITHSMDQVKLWESMAMSAMLAGKKVAFFYPTFSSACGVPAIQNIDVIK